MSFSSPSLKDVGQRIGVSAATVSMALRGDSRISKATQERVRQAAQEIGYQPDPMLSALVARRDRGRKRRTMANVAALVDDRWNNIREPWIERILDGMRTACQVFGYELSVFVLQQDLGPAPGRILQARGMRGIVLLPQVDDNLDIPLDWEHYVTVVIGNSPLSRRMHRVGNDGFAGMNLVCEKLSARGYRRLGLAHPFGAEHRLRYEWLGALSKEHFLKANRLKVAHPHLPERMHPERFLEWVRKEKPDCVITDTPDVLRWLNTGGYRVPEDIGLVYLTMNTGEEPGYSGVAPRLNVAGESAIEQLHASLLRGDRGFPENPKEILIQPLWVDGTTIRHPVEDTQAQNT